MTPRATQREFYTIGEVCELFGMKAHVLRYWETQFPALAPAKSRQGNRLYRPRDLELIALIHRMVRDERYTLEGARTRIDEMRREGTADALAARSLERAFLRSLRGELEQVLALLGPASG
ncbi:MAG: MerR family transcriptional regulator [Gemmatimonadetes bacterium]|nr:MerR family transcriptional regulator [Gemmatimonadota bacterium]